jgi:uncharacterized membrane protein
VTVITAAGQPPNSSARSLSARLAAVLTAGAVIWALVILLAPSSRLPSLVTTAAYATGALVCHQRPERSFHTHGVQFPVCARCTGLYVAGALGALLAWAAGVAMPKHARLLLAAASAPTVATLILEWSGLTGSTNMARFTAALPAGAAAGWVIVRMLRAEAQPAHEL